MPLYPSSIGLRRAIEDDRNADDGESVEDAHGEVLVGDGLEHRLTKTWHADQLTICGAPGQIVSVDTDGIVVTCGEGSLRLTELQKAGGKRLPVAQFLAGNPIDEGSRFTVIED